MRKILTATLVFALAIGLGIGLATISAGPLQAKPNDCLLTITPYYYCVDSPRCHGVGEQFCYECNGVDMYGEPCLCTRVGCMVP